MIAVLRPQGDMIKRLSGGEGIYGFHSRFGLISENLLADRLARRRKKGLKSRDEGMLFRFRVVASDTGAARVEALEGCSTGAGALESGLELSTPIGPLVLSAAAPAEILRAPVVPAKKDRAANRIAATVLALFLLFMLLPMPKIAELPVEPEVVQTVQIQMPVEQKAVVVPKYEGEMLPQELQKAVQDKQVRRAIQQNLGFVGMLGKKDLTKALGGMPTALKDASPGAGAGGKEGSGGETLVGLGDGVKRTTVGNTGVAGLGGIGTKGAGGGAGGYGNTSVGSGEGARLSSVPLSNDMVLDGGLDRSVIQATIAKYLSQVRACYEDGLRSNPGLTGTVAVDFEIGATGDVLRSGVKRSTLGHPGVEGCIVNRAKTWKFPKPLGGVNVKVNYPFLLRPVST